MDERWMKRLEQIKASGVVWDAEHRGEYKSALTEEFGMSDEEADAALSEFNDAEMRRRLEDLRDYFVCD